MLEINRNTSALKVLTKYQSIQLNFKSCINLNIKLIIVAI